MSHENEPIILTPEEWKIMENYLAIRFQALVKRSLRLKSLEKAHNAIAEIKTLPLRSKDAITVVLNFEIKFTAREILVEFRRNPSGMAYERG